MRILITNISANAKRDRTKRNHEQSTSHISINNYILKNFKINYEKKLIIELWHNKRSTYLHIKMRNNRRGSTFVCSDIPLEEVPGIIPLIIL